MMKLQLNINASSLRYAHCLLSWYRVIHEGWVEPKFSDKMVYGMAVHKYLDVMYKTGDMASALKQGLEVFRQPKSMDAKALWISDDKHFSYTAYDVWDRVASCDSTFEIITKPDGLLATEVTFSIPFYEDDNIQVNLCGTIDKIGKIRNGCYAIGDWKTTSTWDADSYLRGYRMSHQLRFYVFALKLMARHFPDSALGQIGATKVGAFIDGIFLKKSPAENILKRSDVFQFDDGDLGSFELSLVRRIEQLSDAIRNGSIGLKEGIVKNTCELKYSKCMFYPVCASNNSQIEEMLLKRNFVQRTYDPLNRDKGV